jgi:ABC-type polysaccharide/polyol phosphate export permease
MEKELERIAEAIQNLANANERIADTLDKINFDDRYGETLIGVLWNLGESIKQTKINT